MHGYGLFKIEDTYFMLSNPFFRKYCRLWEDVGKYGTAGQSNRWRYDTCALHAVIRILQTQTDRQTDRHTHSTEYLLVFHDDNDYANMSQCYVIRTLPACFSRNFVMPVSFAPRSSKPKCIEMRRRLQELTAEISFTPLSEVWIAVTDFDESHDYSAVWCGQRCASNFVQISEKSVEIRVEINLRIWITYYYGCAKFNETRTYSTTFSIRRPAHNSMKILPPVYEPILGHIRTVFTQSTMGTGSLCLGE